MAMRGWVFVRGNEGVLPSEKKIEGETPSLPVGMGTCPYKRVRRWQEGEIDAKVIPRGGPMCLP
jgi:hypothetical protein